MNGYSVSSETCFILEIHKLFCPVGHFQNYNVFQTLSIHSSVYFQTLILEGAKVKLFPSNIALLSNSEPQQFVLLCIPDEPGRLALTGN